jgi:lysophospholipase L1-like esterase
MNQRKTKRSAVLGGATLVALALVLEVAARVSGAVDFPLYHADNQIGYIPAPSQQGAFLRKNTWRFNSLSMGAAEFAPSPAAFDVLLVGDSVVLGGNPFREPDRLGPQLSNVLGSPVWPISAGSWALRNELTYLRLHPNVVRAADAVVFVVNSGDFDQASSWACELTHPQEKPALATVYLFRKYVHGSCDSLRPDMKVPDGNWKDDLTAFLSRPEAEGKPILFFLYPNRAEAEDPKLAASQLEVHIDELRALGIQQTVSVVRDPRWKVGHYQDSVHPTPDGARVLATIIADGIAPLRAPSARLP